MTDKPTQGVAAPSDASSSVHPFEAVTDPDNVPVRVVNGIPQIGIVGSIIAMTCTTARVGFDSTGKIAPDNVICARLRFDLQMAIIMRNMLDAQIALLSTTQSETPN
jgi:hypothetical protein